MKRVKYYITEDGRIGDPYIEKIKEKKEEILPGAALAALFEDEDDDWGDDVPDVSNDFAKIKSGIMEEEEEILPLTAEFEELADGSWMLTRWPRMRRPAYVPEVLEGRPVTVIGATAFAPYHIEQDRFSQLYSSPISFNVFAMRMSKYTITEQDNEGGPTEVFLPETITAIGEHAFWHCDNITSVVIPSCVKSLPAGVFGDCRKLKRVILPDTLTTIGYLPRPTDQVMPDMGTFAGCHELKELVLPSHLQGIGAHVFNSCGIRCLSMRTPHEEERVMAEGVETATLHLTSPIRIAQTAFDHTASLRWMDLLESSGSIIYECALPPARDKILAGDRRFGALLRIPSDFFSKPIAYFDKLAQEAFRLDFSAQMALSRLAYPLDLEADTRKWYFDLLVQYFEKANQFYPEEKGESAYEKLFDFLQAQPDMMAADMSEILRQAGVLGLSADFIALMIEVRTKRFSTITGFEDLDLDLDLDDL